MPPQPEVNSQPSKPWPRRLITDPRQYPRIPWLREERPRLSLRLRPLRWPLRRPLQNHRSPITVSCIQQWPPLSPLHSFLRLSKEITEVTASSLPGFVFIPFVCPRIGYRFHKFNFHFDGNTGGNSEPPSPGLPTLEKIKSGPYDFPADSPTGGNGTQPAGKTTPKAPTAPASNKVQNTPWSTFTNLGMYRNEGFRSMRGYTG